jgi:hypothetical protein
LALIYSFVQIQLIGSEEYAVVARENRMRPIVTRAPRGTIYDRYGQVVAENVVAYQVLLMPAPFDSIRSALDQLTPVLGLTEGDIAVALRRYRREPHLPLEVLRNATPGAVARLEERRFMFPGVLVHEYPKRRYPTGQSVGHLIGYVAEISREELDLPEFRGYRQGRWIGKAGLERAYESEIGGEPGMRYLEVDAAGLQRARVTVGGGLPAEPQFDPGRQFGVPERLGHVVVRSALQGADRVGDRVPRGEDHHRHPGALGAQLVEQFEAVHAGQADVEDDEVELVAQRVVQPGRAVLGHRRLVSLRAEALGDEGGDALLVLDDQDPCHLSLPG